MAERLPLQKHHFEPVYTNGLWLIPTPDLDIKIAFNPQFKDTDGFKDLGRIGDLPILLSGGRSDEIGSTYDPLPSKSPGSKANYLMWKETEASGEKILIAVQLLPEETMTSHHTHDSSEEVFTRLVGELYNYHNGEIVRIHRQLRIRPGDSHLSFTTNQKALTLLVQRGANISHDYIPQPDFSLLKQKADFL